MNELWNDKEKEILYESLTNEELVRKVQKEKDELAKKVLVEKNHKLLHMFTRKYVKYDQGYEYDDIYNEAVLGYINAIYKFDLDKGFTFNTYAGNYAEGQIKRYLRESSDGKCFRIGREWKYLYNKILRSQNELRQTLQREPNYEDIAKYLGKDVKDIERAIILNEEHTSIYLTKYKNKHSDEDNILIVDGIEGDGFDEEKEVSSLELKENLAKLKPKQRRVIEEIYLKGLTQKEYGAKYNLQQPHVSRDLKKAMEQLRKIYKGEVK